VFLKPTREDSDGQHRLDERQGSLQRRRSKMTDEARLDKEARLQNDEARLENEEEDVEGHGALGGALSGGALSGAPRLENEEEDVEAHGALMGGALSGGALSGEPKLAQDEEDEDVEAHSALREPKL
jgi:hypothetical protein